VNHSEFSLALQERNLQMDNPEKHNFSRAIPKGENLGGARRVKVEALCTLPLASRTTLTPAEPP
jgi:hypothetical protein